MTEINLRISEKVQLLVDQTLQQDNKDKFYTYLKEQQMDPEYEEKTVNLVQSIMHTLYRENTKVNEKARRFKNNNEGKGFRVDDLDKEKA
jgi:hypothetical protein